MEHKILSCFEAYTFHYQGNIMHNRYFQLLTKLNYRLFSHFNLSNEEAFRHYSY